MHLPGPLRAAVGLAATAADEARRLPERALELPMLVVSTALQGSLRAQQRYAQLTARGDEVLNRHAPTDEPPAWATFDEPVPLDTLHRTTDVTGDTDSTDSTEASVEPPPAAPDRPRKPRAPRAPRKAAGTGQAADSAAEAKPVRAPRHQPPSRFDAADDD